MANIEDIKRQNGFGIYLPTGVYKLMEDTRKKLGINRSRFIQLAIMYYLQSLSVVSTAVHKEEIKNAGV